MVIIVVSIVSVSLVSVIVVVVMVVVIVVVALNKMVDVVVTLEVIVEEYLDVEESVTVVILVEVLGLSIVVSAFAKAFGNSGVTNENRTKHITNANANFLFDWFSSLYLIAYFFLFLITFLSVKNFAKSEAVQTVPPISVGLPCLLRSFCIFAVLSISFISSTIIFSKGVLNFLDILFYPSFLITVLWELQLEDVLLF